MSVWQCARMLAACATVKALYGVTTTAAAYERIIWPHAYDDPAHPQYLNRPRIIVAPAGTWDADPVDIGAFTGIGWVEFTIERPAYQRWDLWPDGFWPENFWAADFWPSQVIEMPDRFLDALNVFGSIHEELLGLSGRTPEAGDIFHPTLEVSYSQIGNTRVVEEAGFSNPAEANDEYFSFMTFGVELK